MNIKTIIDFTMEDDVEMVICNWAEKNGFIECPDTGLKGIVDINNVTYCYYLKQSKTTTFLTIHQLDGIIRLEAWIAEEVNNDKTSITFINELLISLGQGPIE